MFTWKTHRCKVSQWKCWCDVYLNLKPTWVSVERGFGNLVSQLDTGWVKFIFPDFQPACRRLGAMLVDGIWAVMATCLICCPGYLLKIKLQFFIVWKDDPRGLIPCAVSVAACLREWDCATAGSTRNQHVPSQPAELIHRYNLAGCLKKKCNTTYQYNTYNTQGGLIASSRITLTSKVYDQLALSAYCMSIPTVFQCEMTSSFKLQKQG